MGGLREVPLPGLKGGRCTGPTNPRLSACLLGTSGQGGVLQVMEQVPAECLLCTHPRGPPGPWALGEGTHR